MSIEEKRDALIEELIPFEDHLERLTYVIDRAKDQPGLDEEYKIDTFLIKGCVSQLWLLWRCWRVEACLCMVALGSSQWAKFSIAKVTEKAG